MRKIIFASNNQHKADEIKRILGNEYEVITLKQAGINIDIPEPHDTFQENALEKSTVIFNMTGKDCFSEDSGLEVEALGSAPGVQSARYAGSHGQDNENMEKLLHKMENKTNRNAQFRTVISLMLNGKNYFFEGACKGRITYEKIGTNGFGYDPIFIPTGEERTFAQFTMEEKSKMSHRKQAISKMAEFLKERGLTNEVSENK
jgi:XTP/dITP diphosphohydrolase